MIWPIKGKLQKTLVSLDQRLRHLLKNRKLTRRRPRRKMRRCIFSPFLQKRTFLNFRVNYCWKSCIQFNQMEADAESIEAKMLISAKLLERMVSCHTWMKWSENKDFFTLTPPWNRGEPNTLVPGEPWHIWRCGKGLPLLRRPWGWVPQPSRWSESKNKQTRDRVGFLKGKTWICKSSNSFLNHLRQVLLPLWNFAIEDVAGLEVTQLQWSSKYNGKTFHLVWYCCGLLK